MVTVMDKGPGRCGDSIWTNTVTAYTYPPPIFLGDKFLSPQLPDLDWPRLLPGCQVQSWPHAAHGLGKSGSGCSTRKIAVVLNRLRVCGDASMHQPSWLL
jgi:hypothetical protein